MYHADPMVALDALTRQHSSFTHQHLVRFLDRQMDRAEQFEAVLAAVQTSPALVHLGQDGRGRDRFSTCDMLRQVRCWQPSEMGCESVP